MTTLSGRTLLNRYFLRELVGSGGMADVYLAWDKLRSVKMAIKVLRRNLSSNNNFLQQFGKEAEILRTLEHPNIVRLFEFEQDNDIAFIVMDWVDGSDLRQIIHNSKLTLPLTDISRILEAVCSALYYAHENHIYHCDIKPANIMLHIDGRVLLTDFGVAHMSEETGGGGTPPYMAPEQFTGGKIDAYTDVYALGITLFEVLSGGHTPYRGLSSSSDGSTTKERIAWEHLNLSPPALSQFNAQISPEMGWVVNKAIQKNPKKRFQSTLELRDAFEKARTTMPDMNPQSTLGILDNLSSLASAAASAAVSAAAEAVNKILPKPGKTDFTHKYPTPSLPDQSNAPGKESQVIGKPAQPNVSLNTGRGPFLLCRSGQWAGQSMPIPLGETIIGRGSQSHIKLTEMIISRRHATIIHTKRGVYIRDDGSSLGTYVNGVRINGPVLLKDCDVIQIGYQQVFEYRNGG